MRSFILLLGLAVCATAQEIPLDAARVQIPYRELRALIDAAQPKPQPPAPPPVDNALLSAAYELQLREGTVSGLAGFDVQTFSDGPHAVPLIGDAVIVEAVEPKEAVLVPREGHYALVLEGKQRAKVSLRFTLPLRKSEDGLAAECPICPAVSTGVLIRDIPAGRHASLADGICTESSEGTSKWQLGRSSALRLAVREEPKSLPPPITMPAVISDAMSEMRVVSDGALFSKMKWRIRHRAPLVWKLGLPDNFQIISAEVGGKPASPLRVDAKTLEFRLPEPANVDETVVELRYTAKGKALQAERGELTLGLPSTSLLIENLQWRLVLPAPYETDVTQSNMSVQPGQAGEILLSKEFCEGDAPAIRLVYQVPPSITMPAVIREAQSEMRVVSDGAFSNKMTWCIRHHAPLVWKLGLPENLQIVSASVGGKSVSPSRTDAKTLEFRLPEPGADHETKVELNYTGKGQAFEPVRGELALALPQTPLLIENLQWRLVLPAAYETVAAQGNMDFLPGKTSGEVLLGKELCQGEAPAIRLFYQKPESSKKP